MKGNHVQPTDTILNRMADFQFDGEAFRQARLARRLTQGKLGALLGVSQQFVKLLERGDRRPSLDLIARMEDVFQAAPDQFGVTGLPPRIARSAA